jgi:peptidoglycan-associated lipoprotein
MNSLISLSGRILSVVLVLFLASCANKSKQNGEVGGAGGSEGVFDQPMPARDGSNPLTDYDWSIFGNETVYFAFDRSDVQASERGKLEKVAADLKQNPDRKIMLAGHTDERGTLEYNRGLGERRALAVRNYLIGLGVDASHLSTISYGEEIPALQGTTEDAYAKNRRVQIGVLKK